MTDTPSITRIRRVGGARYVAVSPALLAELGWNTKDFIAARVAGGKLVMERVPMERLSKLKAVTSVPRAGGTNAK